MARISKSKRVRSSAAQGWQVDLMKKTLIGKDVLAKIKAEGGTYKLAGP